ncbi:Der GTPase-activating protein YihI [Serratia microhaemolytica]|uniref:Der GTPase-activating protein YihI n=1 Tax=Serratia microhaemolytica TaxID=2675110 RepID=UPI000FDD1555|nr:Der GTPase-activating protein YihI [Serratia microhaemolytica]
MKLTSNSSHTARQRAASTKRKKKSRAELDLEARERKREKKRRGHTPGSRTQVASDNRKNSNAKQSKDPRIGSKVPVPLLADSRTSHPPVAKLKIAPPPLLSAEEELSQLENDADLERLLDRFEQGEELSQQEQDYMTKQLQRIEALMAQLGIEIDDADEQEEEKQEDILRLLKGGSAQPN